ncbi:hypothetical protein CR513_29557 [Mucuna pruriens]|uniref:Uncharacterized protein n=1 Tax=Mucuna pruriens TaxID=157652 RepID=A0A371GE31_MUCPR|nr:hypothetical protein CR513_29557 [Mucuna pruriens]
MPLSKLLLASLLASLLLLQLVHADQSIVREHVVRGAVYHLVHDCAKERVGHVVDDATACHQALLVTKKCVPVMQA